MRKIARKKDKREVTVIWSEKDSTALSFAGKLLLFSLVTLGIPFWNICSNWHNFKGAYLVDRNQLSTTWGKITSATTYTSKPNRKTYYHYEIEYEFAFEERVFQSDEVTFDDRICDIRRYPSQEGIF